MPRERRLIELNKRDRYNSWSLLVVDITGASLATSLGTGGVTIGSKCVTAKDDGSNTVTIQFNDVLRTAPLVMFQENTANCSARKTSVSTSQVVYNTVQDADGSTAVADANVTLYIWIPGGLETL